MFQRFLLVLLLPTMAACRPDDDKGDTSEEADADTDTDADTDSIAGDWVSEGDNLARLFVEYTDYVSILATFGGEGPYEVEATREAAASDTFAGVYTVDLSTSPHGITLEQSSPSKATAVGIWLVEDDVLTYEVLQIEPDTTRCTPPTAAEGFGSTDCNYLEPGDNVQTYVRR